MRRGILATLGAIGLLSVAAGEVGRLEIRAAKEIDDSPWSVTCDVAGEDRLAELGAKRVRLIADGATIVGEKGAYDFTPLDRQVREASSSGITPWICLWRSDLTVRQVTDDNVAFAAWLAYVKAAVVRYKGLVSGWEIWNEAPGQGQEYGALVVETAKAVHAIQPGATCFVTPLAWDENPADNDYVLVAEKLRQKGVTGLVTKWLCRPSSVLPEKSYRRAEQLRRLVTSYSSTWDVLLSGSRRPPQLDSPVARAKWDLRLAIGARARKIDAHLTFDGQEAGFRALRNVYSYFDGEVEPQSVRTEGFLTICTFTRQAEPIVVVWRGEALPAETCACESVDLSAVLAGVKSPVRVDLMTGRIDSLEELTETPVSDAPVMIAPGNQVPQQTVWAEVYPELPCFDKYGQEKRGTWPTKILSDEGLKEQAEVESADLAAHPGPTGRNRYGGWLKGPELKATGRFRTAHVNGKWWLVDPEGRLFWSWGPMCVTPSSAMTPLNGNPRSPRVGGNLPDRDCLFEGLPQYTGATAKDDEPLLAFYETGDVFSIPFYLARHETRWYDFSSANLYRKYGENWFETYTELCHRRLRSWGCTTIGHSSDLRICRARRTPYLLTVANAADLGETGCAGDPWCLGVYVLNASNEKTCRDAVRAFDSDVLFFGHGRFCDVLCVTEADSRRDVPTVLFATAETRDRAVARAAIEASVAAALQRPQVVGVHWRQFGDQAMSGRFDGESYRFGWTDQCDTPDRELVDALRAIDVYMRYCAR